MTETSIESRHVGTRIDRPASEVYDFAVEPTNLPRWAPGLGSSVESVDGQWVVDSPMGHVGLRFVARNDYGVLDHYVTLPSGPVFHNPMRVIDDGPACDVVFTVRRRLGTSSADFARDIDAVTADLDRLRRELESRL